MFCFFTAFILGHYDKSKGALVYTTYADLRKMIEQFAAGLRQLMGDNFHPMVAMCANSRIEWYIADFACILLGIPTVSHVKVFVHVISMAVCKLPGSLTTYHHSSNMNCKKWAKENLRKFIVGVSAERYEHQYPSIFIMSSLPKN